MSESSNNNSHGRFARRPSSTDSEALQFQAQLEASLKDFDPRSALHADSSPSPGAFLDHSTPSQFPELGLPVAPRVPQAPASGPASPLAQPPASAAGFELLAELRQAAWEKALDTNVREQEQAARAEAAGLAMRQLLQYLNEFCRHLDTIRPPIPRSFLPLPRIALNSLHWVNSFIDFRTKGGTEISPVDSVALRYTIGAGDSILIEKLPPYAAAYHEELKRVGLRYTATEKRGTRGLVEQVDFHVAREITVSLLAKADPDRQLLHLRTRNFTELDNRIYSLPIAEVTPQWLDELGKHILGRPSRLFDTLQRL